MNEQQGPSQEEMQNVVKAVKAESFDMITALNKDFEQAKQQITNMNAILQQVVKVVSPDNAELTINELMDKLEALVKSNNEGQEDGEAS